MATLTNAAFPSVVLKAASTTAVTAATSPGYNPTPLPIPQERMQGGSGTIYLALTKVNGAPIDANDTLYVVGAQDASGSQYIYRDSTFTAINLLSSFIGSTSVKIAMQVSLSPYMSIQLISAGGAATWTFDEDATIVFP